MAHYAQITVLGARRKDKQSGKKKTVPAAAFQ